MGTEGIRKFVRERYAGIASGKGSCCGPSSCGVGEGKSCAGDAPAYSEEEIRSAPEGADLGLGCGNPVAIASLTEGETVLDLGSGAGLDCFLAAKKVGPAGRVIGVDMTPEMVEKARGNATRSGLANVEFRLGEIENLPAADASADVVISNCVINLSPEKARVFSEAFRVLRPGGRVMISDLVLAGELPAAVRESLGAYAGCVGGAVPLSEYLRLLESAGFRDVRVEEEKRFEVPFGDENVLGNWFADAFRIPLGTVREAAKAIRSVSVSGVKPGP
jgi:SAM-dependent methyltransferase